MARWAVDYATQQGKEGGKGEITALSSLTAAADAKQAVQETP
jgi:hypothetical protein